MAVVVAPTSKHLIRFGAASLASHNEAFHWRTDVFSDWFADFVYERDHALFGRGNMQCSAMFAKVLHWERKSVISVRDLGFSGDNERSRSKRNFSIAGLAFSSNRCLDLPVTMKSSAYPTKLFVMILC